MTHDPELVRLVADLLEDLDGNDLEVVARAVLDAITEAETPGGECPEPR